MKLLIIIKWFWQIAKQGKGMWLDSSGKVSGRQYIKEQGDLLFEKILFHWKNSLEEEKFQCLYYNSFY